MKTLVAFAVLLASLSAASAMAGLTFRVQDFRSEPVNGITKVTLTPTSSGGMMALAIDSNTCDARGNCTKLAVVTTPVRPTLSSDQRPTDGPASFKLTDDARLEVGSGFTPDGSISYTVILLGGAGRAPTRIKLRANVVADIVRESSLPTPDDGDGNEYGHP